jgi:glycosyltransferase involved in cell wall biosynthesis
MTDVFGETGASHIRRAIAATIHDHPPVPSVRHENSNSPLVSIGMPTYNGEEFLASSLDSLLSQDYQNFELVISDNGSTDNTEVICRRYAARDARLRFVRQDRNYGAVDNFNFVLNSARGKYFMWASDHDLWDRSLLSKCVEAMEDANDVVLTYSRTLLIDRAGEAIQLTPDRIDTRGMNRHQRYTHMIWNLHWCNMIYGVMRTNAVARVGRVKNLWAPDLLFLAELSLHGTYALVDEPLFSRRENRQQQDAQSEQRAMAGRLDPAGAHKLAERTHDERYRQLRNAHLEMLMGSSLSPTEKAYAMVSTLLCYRHRFGVSIRGIESILVGLKHVIPDGIRVHVLNRIDESNTHHVSIR